jgi:dihydrofolate reductase
VRKLIWLIHTTLDGFVSGPNGELDWAGAAMDDELWEDVKELMDTVDGTLFERGTYQDFESYWPAVGKNPASGKNELHFSRWIQETPKTVASRTLKKLEWKNSVLVSEDVAESVSRMKGQAGRDVLMFGCPGLASDLWKAGLIDELRIDVHPLVLGEGRALFANEAVRRRLKLTKAKTFGSGVVGVRYNFA